MSSKNKTSHTLVYILKSCPSDASKNISCCDAILAPFCRISTLACFGRTFSLRRKNPDPAANITVVHPPHRDEGELGHHLLGASRGTDAPPVTFGTPQRYTIGTAHGRAVKFGKHRILVAFCGKVGAKLRMQRMRNKNVWRRKNVSNNLMKHDVQRKKKLKVLVLTVLNYFDMDL